MDIATDKIAYVPSTGVRRVHDTPLVTATSAYLGVSLGRPYSSPSIGSSRSTSYSSRRVAPTSGSRCVAMRVP